MTVMCNLMGMTEGDQKPFSRSLLLHTLELGPQIAAMTCSYGVLTANQTGPSPTTPITETRSKTPDFGLLFLLRLKQLQCWELSSQTWLLISPLVIFLMYFLPSF